MWGTHTSIVGSGFNALFIVIDMHFHVHFPILLSYPDFASCCEELVSGSDEVRYPAKVQITS